MIEIRPATAPDLAALRAVGEDAPADATLVVLFHGEVAGWGRVLRDGPHARLDVGVARAFRGLGLGRMVLAALESRAAAEGAEEAAVVPEDAAGFEGHGLLARGYEARAGAFVRRLP